MTLTINELGEALTETKDGVTFPIDCSFEKVNGWIHGIDVHFEEVQALCLGMASENDKLRQALLDIKKHQEVVCGDDPKFSATWYLANRALGGNDE